MKKIWISLMLFAVLTAAYIRYTGSQIDAYIYMVSHFPNKIATAAQAGEEVKVKEIIRRTPRELIMIISFGESDAYVRVKNWLTIAHDDIEIRYFEKGRIRLLE